MLGNATKFTPKGGTISIECKQENENVKISVSDTGIGIPEEKQDIIFNAFKKAHNKTRANEKGTGLGLAICKNIIDLHNGEIRVNSKVDKGSVFTVCLPVSTSGKRFNS